MPYSSVASDYEEEDYELILDDVGTWTRPCFSKAARLLQSSSILLQPHIYFTTTMSEITQRKSSSKPKSDEVKKAEALQKYNDTDGHFSLVR